MFLLFSGELFAQVTINTDGSAPNNSAILDVKATNKGVLFPRITKSQRNLISAPAEGLIVFCTNCGTDGALSIYSNGAWRTLLPCILAAPVAGNNVISEGQIIWNWLATIGATGYKWGVTPVYETATDMGANLSKTETGTSCNNTYTRYIWAYSGCGESGMTTLTQTTFSAPVAPTAGTHFPTQTSVVWNWNSVASATGYKWSTTNVFSTATDMGMATTKTETCLTSGASYTRYVWAYNSCGYSPLVTLMQSTTLPITQDFEGSFPPSGWLRYSGLLANPTTLTAIAYGWTQYDWRNVTSPVNKAAGINIWSNSCNYWLTTPPINVGSGSVNYLLEFDLALTIFGSSGVATTNGTDDKFAVVISTNGGLSWSSTNTLRLWNNTGSPNIYNSISNAGEHVIIPLTGYTGIVMLGFYGESTVSNADNDLFIDNVFVHEATTCFEPTAIVAGSITQTTATISWTAPSPAPSAGYNYEVRTSGSGGSGITGLAASGSTSAGIVTANITSLSPSVTYYVYVRSNCGLCSYSLWEGPVTFNTVCGAAIIPFTESFDDVIFAPSCWTNVKTAGTGTPGTWDRQTAGTYPPCTPHSGAGMARYNSFSLAVGTKGILVTSQLNIPGDQYKVKFWMYRDDGYAGTTDLINVFSNTNPNTTGATLLGTVNRNYLMSPAVNTPNQWYEYGFNMPSGTSGNVYIVFEAVSAYGNDMFVDDVSLIGIGSFSCGSSITINHLAGIVAPVNKTVTYGTVTNIPGETAKCWITSNLGADHQAIAVDDATEPSAGWYWQFNRKQGYKHTGSAVTPAWTITFIYESSDWLTANDPCNIELGSAWRIPTYTEWYNVDNSGGWTNWNGPWGSSLKLHAAGYIEHSVGSLNYRGSNGDYYSSTQYSSNSGWGLAFNSGSLNMLYMPKAWGTTLRCLKDLCSSPSTPTTGTNVPSQTQIIWNWNPVTGATGYKWNTTNTYATATDMGTATTKTETGLTCGTAYTRYVWAYNSCGNSTPVSLSQTTSSCSFSCGSSITINHLAGLVAPVSKTVTYGTVTNIPGETAKCWITSNLGADHQATAVSDATEASAGWYWQFNRKQGYKHTGSALTPAWTITSINESSDWLTANDPCNIELGTAWRIPTYTEWYNVDNTGGWTNWNGPWNSGLKLHGAGYLEFGDGSLGYRGSGGNYWSCTQESTYSGHGLYINSGNSVMNYPTKAYGISLRCLKDACSSPSTPTSGMHSPSQTQIIWNWNTVTGATGYKWNTTNTIATATDMGTATTKTETGLTCGTAYTRYVWAYNSCGNSTPVSLSQTTSSCSFSCGSSITINHLAGIVSPVTKTVTYGTVTNIPGETSKCWITRNLGANQQATAVNDATEASAGWYWQFNRKQGYQHTGSAVTPAWTITSLSESSNWLTANDPCNIELGAAWRIPTYTEWYNVDNTGGWTNWNGPWISGLKLHAAGYLWDNDGSLGERGSAGNYWSSAQVSALVGWNLDFDSGTSIMDNTYYKANGFSLRCIK